MINLGFLACSAIPLLVPSLVAKVIDSVILDITIIAFGIFVCSVYLSAAAYSVRIISDYGTYTFGDFFAAFKKAWPSGLVMGAFAFVIFMVATFVLPFYLSVEPPMLGLAITAIIFWTSLFAVLSFQYFFTVYARLSTNIGKAVKKCILIAMDNTGFSIFLLFHNILALLLSVVFAFMFPGFVGVVLFNDQALRLRLLKYDWLEANPNANRRKIPWDALLIEDREKTGTRSLKNFIFPWKY